MNQSKANPIITDDVVLRLTALWALSEAAFAGILHALRIPLTGMFIGSAAILFITMIHVFKPQRGVIVKATILVMIIKAMVSPHTPATAYLAVAFQGLAGEFIFNLVRRPFLSAFVLAFLAMLEAALQKIFILTLVFGQTLWESINIFGHFILQEIFISQNFPDGLNISLILVLLYTSLHLIMAFIIGTAAPRLATRLFARISDGDYEANIQFNSINTIVDRPKGSVWRKKISLFFFIVIAGTLFVGSYVFPLFEKSQGIAAVVMILRSIVIMLVWYFFVAPFVMARLQRYLHKKQSVYSFEIQHILQIFPVLKNIIRFSWKESENHKGLKRLNNFMELLLLIIVTIDIKNIKKSSHVVKS